MYWKCEFFRFHNEKKYFILTVYCRYGHFSGINRKVQMKYQPKGRPRGSSSDDGNGNNTSMLNILSFLNLLDITFTLQLKPQKNH